MLDQCKIFFDRSSTVGDDLFLWLLAKKTWNVGRQHKCRETKAKKLTNGVLILLIHFLEVPTEEELKNSDIIAL